MQAFFHEFLKLFFILTPFFVLSSFLSMTQDCTPGERRRIAIQTMLATMVSTLCLYFFGRNIFELFGITLDAFRVGAGVLLFRSALELVGGAEPATANGRTNISVVPLAIPITVGPGTTGALMIMSADAGGLPDILRGLAALALAVACVGGLLLCASSIERIIKRQGLVIMSKLTGLVLASIAAQIILTGVSGFFPGGVK